MPFEPNPRYLRLFHSIWVLIFFLPSSYCSKILFFNGMGEGSHYSAASSLAEELYAGGHSVTFLIGKSFEFRAHHPDHKDMFQFRIVNSENPTNASFKKATTEAFNGNMVSRDMEWLDNYGKAMAEECEDILRDTTILKELREANFDLMICDIFWPCTVIIGDFLGVEKVALIPVSMSPATVRLLGGTTSPAINVEMCLGFPTKMTFLQRVINFIAYTPGEYGLVRYNDNTHSHIFKRMGLQGYWESIERIHLHIIASDPIFDQVVPTMPGRVDAAGLTIREPNPLNRELEAFVQSAEEAGVIIFTLGNYVTHMPEDIVTVFRDAFARIPQKVIWQWKGEHPPENMSENVKCMNWLPQQDLLAHNQTKLLIYQGGNNGVYEAIYHAVPILVMPLLADQIDIAARIVERGIGLSVSAPSITTEELVQKIETLLTERSFKENVTRMSAIFRDRPQTPRQRAAFMIEHVLKFGSNHLRSPAHDLNYIQLHMLDVLAFLLICLTITVFVVYKLLRTCLRVCSWLVRSTKAKAE